MLTPSVNLEKEKTTFLFNIVSNGQRMDLHHPVCVNTGQLSGRDDSLKMYQKNIRRFLSFHKESPRPNPIEGIEPSEVFQASCQSRMQWINDIAMNYRDAYLNDFVDLM